MAEGELRAGAATPARATRAAEAPPRATRATLVEGPPGRVLAQATAPLAGALLVMFGIQTAETWLVGLLGATSLAALGFALPVVLTAISFGIGLGAGASAAVARALGAGEPGVAGRSRHALWLTAGVALGVAVPGWLGAGWLLREMGAAGEVHELALQYLRLWFLGAVPLLVGMVALSLIRAAGDTVFQGTALAGAGALAFLLDWPLAFGMPGLLRGLGLPGLALAAALSWGAMLLLALRRLRALGLLGGTGEDSAAPRFASSARLVLRVGLPAAATNAIIPVATGIFTAMLAAHGTAAVAGFGIGSRVESLAMTALFALSAVANPFAAQNQGAGRLDRVHRGMRAAMVFCAAYGVTLALALILAGPLVARLFTGDPATRASAALYLAVLPWGFGAIGAIAVANAAFNGLGRPMAAVGVSLLRTFLLGVPLAWLGGRLAGEAGTLAGILLANLLAGGVAAAWVLRATRRR